MVSKLNSERQAGESAGAAMSRIYNRIGFSGLWNGLPVRIVMIGTLTGLQWCAFFPKMSSASLMMTGWSMTLSNFTVDSLQRVLPRSKMEVPRMDQFNLQDQSSSYGWMRWGDSIILSFFLVEWFLKWYRALLPISFVFVVPWFSVESNDERFVVPPLNLQFDSSIYLLNDDFLMTWTLLSNCGGDRLPSALHEIHWDEMIASIASLAFFCGAAYI